MNGITPHHTYEETGKNEGINSNFKKPVVVLTSSAKGFQYSVIAGVRTR